MLLASLPDGQLAPVYVALQAAGVPEDSPCAGALGRISGSEENLQAVAGPIRMASPSDRLTVA